MEERGDQRLLILSIMAGNNGVFNHYLYFSPRSLGILLINKK